MIKLLKVLWIAFRHPPKQEFRNELYQHEQAKHYQRHFGIGDGGKSIQGKYINKNTRYR